MNKEVVEVVNIEPKKVDENNTEIISRKRVRMQTPLRKEKSKKKKKGKHFEIQK